MAELLTTGVGLVVVALLVLAQWCGSTTITPVGSDGCLAPNVELPAGELTIEVATRLYSAHRYCSCRIRTLSRDFLESTDGPIPDEGTGCF